MIRTYTEEEMLSLYKRRLGLFEARNGGIVGRQDGNHLDEYLLTEMRAWYANLLRTADVGLLPVEDLSSEIDSSLYVDNATAEISLPARGIRLVSIKFKEWKQEVRFFYTPESEMAQMQKNYYLRATTRNPIVVVDRDKLIAYGVSRPTVDIDPSTPEIASATPQITPMKKSVEKLLMIAEPTDGTYRFDDSLLLTIH